MSKGFHFGRVKTRQYTVEYPKLCANSFKPLLKLPLGKYCLTSQSNSRPIELKETSSGIRFVSLEHESGELQLGLITCERSASKKLYITCPYCQTKRQHLYQCKSGYACRTCLKLHYASQSERKKDRLARRIRKLRRAIWGDINDIYNLTESAMYFSKPKYKRWDKFEQEKEKVLELEKQYWQLSEAHLEKLFGNICTYSPSAYVPP
ncbi:hypothetical protein [Pseudoalteromonas sp. HM-SA03]|uniref:hypothetical protein n=1 Tax=Pseudoalteromonas sp. HM-SA03 TaxID=2029678 RepID=UPI001595C315|nr:hypothetical protein [Pseudoalteromonas sp. HM-SA03]